MRAALHPQSFCWGVGQVIHGGGGTGKLALVKPLFSSLPAHLAGAKAGCHAVRSVRHVSSLRGHASGIRSYNTLVAIIRTTDASGTVPVCCVRGGHGGVAHTRR